MAVKWKTVVYLRLGSGRKGTSMNQTIANLCTRCETKFIQWSQYHQHITNNTCAKKIKPLNTSGRTKAEIVGNVENTWLKKYLI